MQELLREACKFYAENKLCVVQDNCGGHIDTSPQWEMYKAMFFHNVNFLPHPPNSPDLNLSENYWLYMEGKLRNHSRLTEVATLQDWIRLVHETYVDCTQPAWWGRMRLRGICNFYHTWRLHGGNHYARTKKKRKKNCPG